MTEKLFTGTLNHNKNKNKKKRFICYLTLIQINIDKQKSLLQFNFAEFTILSELADLKTETWHVNIQDIDSIQKALAELDDWIERRMDSV